MKPAVGADAGSLLRDGQDALGGGDWEVARARFAASLAVAESPEALDGLATCCRFIGALDESLAARERAYRLFRDRGDAAAATVAAAWLGRDSGLPRGELSVARAWFSVARRQAAQTDSIRARGTLDYYEGQFVLLGEIDAPKAGDLGARARAAGRECGDLDLEMQGLSLEGLAHVAEGRVTEGMLLLEEAAASVLGGDVSAADAAGWICCHLIYACERVSDTRRAAEWCTAMRGFCERWDMPGMFGMCLAHHGTVLMHEGRWAEAEAEFMEAAELFAAAAPALGYEAVIRLAELRRHQGRLDEVEMLTAALEPTPVAWVALPTAAWLALEKGQSEDAHVLLDRYFRASAERDRMVRSDALELAVQAHLARGALEDATAAADALATLATSAGTERLAGAAELARGRTLVGRGDHEAARTALESAVDLHVRAGAPYDEAMAREALAATLLLMGGTERSRHELQLARDIFEGLGASRDLERTTRAMVGATPTGGHDRWSLTERELDVLRLAATGLSNAGIAEQMHLSVHTVHRHIANIRTKLGGGSKAAIVARATRDGLI